MTALTTPCAGMFFLSGDRFGCVAFQFSGRRKEFAARVKPSSQPLLLRHSPGFPNGKRGRGRGRGGEVWAEEDLGGRYNLEAEIYGFMVESKTPSEFPSKEALIAAGREDLAIAIAKEGGWLAYGWNLDEEEGGKDLRGVSNFAYGEPCEEDRIASSQETPSVDVEACLNDDSNNLSTCSEGSSRSSSSHRPMETEASENEGIEGLLIRLEKERSLAFGFLLQKGKERKIAKEQNLPDVAAGHSNTVRSVESTERFISSSPGEKGHPRTINSPYRTPMDVDNISSGCSMWRAWSKHKSGDPLAYFEAAEIVSSDDQRSLENVEKVTGDQDMTRTNGSGCMNELNQDIIQDISEGFQELETQLTSTLHQLRFKNVDVYKVQNHQNEESLLLELQKLSDVLEFQQNEIKKARDILRSTKAKLAVMEGKIALQATETHKVLQQRNQRKLEASSPSSLFLLRSVCITWSNSASEVLLAGSFDGWTNHRRMENSNTRMFTLKLKLYPGRYEIKFIVDGVWAVDPLRPIVGNNGFENNLLIVP